MEKMHEKSWDNVLFYTSPRVVRFHEPNLGRHDLRNWRSLGKRVRAEQDSRAPFLLHFKF